MQIIRIDEKKLKIYLPEDLSECDSRQYIEMSHLIVLLQSKQISYEDFRVHALYKLLNMKPVNVGLYDADKYARIYQLSELIDSFFEPGQERVLKQFYIKNPAPKAFVWFRTHIGPTNEEDFTFGEYIDTLEALLDFTDTGEIDYLIKMFAINYRRVPLFKSNKRKNVEKYNQVELNRFKNNHIGEIYGFYLYFTSVNKYISTAKIFVQGKEIDLSIIFDLKDNDKSKHPGIGMKSILYTLAESGIYGNINDVRDVKLWEVLVRMYDVTKASLDEKERLKNEK